MAYTPAQMLEAVEDAIQYILTGRNIRYRVEGTEFEKLPLSDLLALRKHYKDELNSSSTIEQVVFEV